MRLTDRRRQREGRLWANFMGLRGRRRRASDRDYVAIPRRYGGRAWRTQALDRGSRTGVSRRAVHAMDGDARRRLQYDRDRARRFYCGDARRRADGRVFQFNYDWARTEGRTRAVVRHRMGGRIFRRAREPRACCRLSGAAARRSQDVARLRSTIADQCERTPRRPHNRPVRGGVVHAVHHSVFFVRAGPAQSRCQPCRAEIGWCRADGHAAVAAVDAEPADFPDRTHALHRRAYRDLHVRRYLWCVRVRLGPTRAWYLRYCADAGWRVWGADWRPARRQARVKDGHYHGASNFADRCYWNPVCR